MILIDSDAVGRRMRPEALIAALREGHRHGRMPDVGRTLLEQASPAASVLSWTGWSADIGIAVKSATTFPNGASGSVRPNVQSVVVLFEPVEGSPVAVIHGESFTRMKTAADSALGVDLLARTDVGTLGVLGAGGQAATHIRFLRAARASLRTVLVWNRSREAADRLVDEISRTGLACRSVETAEEATTSADVVSCLTGARDPVLEGEWLRDGSHVDLVGSYTPAMRESDDAVIRRGRLFVDSRRFGIVTCGDYGQPIASGLITEGDILADLFELVSGRASGRCEDRDITVFKNGGGGHLDLMAAAAFLEAARGAR